MTLRWKKLHARHAHTSFIVKVPLDVGHAGSAGHPTDLYVALRVPVTSVSLGGLSADAAL